jgi:hypothetical protein
LKIVEFELELMDLEKNRGWKDEVSTENRQIFVEEEKEI